MRQWARACVAAGASVSLGWLAGCNGEHGAGDDAARVAAEQEVEPFDPALTRNLPPGVTAESAQQGRELYAVCATCHGPDARGTQLGPSLREQEWLHIDGSYEEIQRIVREGVAEPEEFPVPMPPDGGGAFTEQQLRNVSAYVFALSRP
ncbi:MAG: cytochrome c [Gemmatimonadetes bacterium]|nr:cytochrome c [Gemmatimonadota bacterium]